MKDNLELDKERAVVLTVDQLRSMFLEFFQGKGHKILPSSSLVPEGDPSLLLTGAGMVPFKPYFLGQKESEHKMVTTCQRCIRTADLEQVGVTARHGTFFEMLGNFSFGSYFKKEAIAWSWEFVTEKLQIPKEKLWITIYLDDDEAFDLWHQEIGVPAERIVRMGKEDNFWEIGVGPCGPCSELHIDRGPEHGCGRPDCSVECDCDRFLEFWNLVFIQFYQDEKGELHPLEKKGIDTGMGLERIAAIMQDQESIFEIDNLAQIVHFMEQKAAKENPVSVRVIADHMRAATFLALDGVLPSNEGRGYVMRRLIRRSIRHGKLLGVEDPFLAELVDLIVEVMAPGYPELLPRKEQIKTVLVREESNFSATLSHGLQLLEELLAEAQGEICGEEAFKLHDTFGFPLELTEEIASERGIKVDRAGFEKAMEEQRTRARAARAKTGYLNGATGFYAELAKERELETGFVGYEQGKAQGTVLAMIQEEQLLDTAEAGMEFELILDRTPFYAESGGQLADTGLIWADGVAFEVKAVHSPAEKLIVHRGVLREGTIRLGDNLVAEIEGQLRADTCRNHTATHLLHKALRKVLGEHVEQAGSQVSPGELRFDFKHFEAPSKEELAAIEKEVNQAILANLPVATQEMSMEEAQAQGALALFSEKYGDEVRVVSIGDGYSRELCGGTHARATGELGLFTIISEGSIASGVRRIVALTGERALSKLQQDSQTLKQVAETLNAKEGEVLAKLTELEAKLAAQAQELEKFAAQSIASEGRALAKQAESIGSAQVLVAEVEGYDSESLKLLADVLRDELPDGVALLGSRKDGGALFLALVADGLVKQGLNAGNIVREAAKVAGGGGGGRPQLAQAGGKKGELIPEALRRGKEEIEKALK